jgi:hypothetical protein
VLATCHTSRGAGTKGSIATRYMFRGNHKIAAVLNASMLLPLTRLCSTLFGLCALHRSNSELQRSRFSADVHCTDQTLCCPLLVKEEKLCRGRSYHHKKHPMPSKLDWAGVCARLSSWHRCSGSSSQHSSTNSRTACLHHFQTTVELVSMSLFAFMQQPVMPRVSFSLFDLVASVPCGEVCLHRGVVSLQNRHFCHRRRPFCLQALLQASTTATWGHCALPDSGCAAEVHGDQVCLHFALLFLHQQLWLGYYRLLASSCEVGG